MSAYYTEKLSAERLRMCYEVAPPAVRVYLEAEIEHVRSRTSPEDRLLELGCGYGRVLAALARDVRSPWGIDTSESSLRMARRFVEDPRCRLVCMDATRLALRDRSFDVVICIQNGVSAFAVDQDTLFREAVRVTRPGGVVMFSSYAARFWPDRLAWFEAQARLGLLGEIDHDATRDGVIVCKDGFRATTVSVEDFGRLAASVGITPKIEEVAGSSLFCEMVVE
jgi:2-polyprenyl-6-hydroxyphenyl methylase/3-demethylubiquinone-9 3-methyltransferase